MSRSHPATTPADAASDLHLGQIRQSHLFGPLRITAFRVEPDRVVHCRSLDDTAMLTLSARYCARLPLVGNV